MPFKKTDTDTEADPLDVPIVRHWWDGYEHPLTDAQFVEAFCAQVFVTTSDHSLRTLRNRAFRFIRNFLASDLEHQLSDYRKDHP